MKRQKLRLTKCDELLTIHYETAIKIAEIEMDKELTEQEAITKWTELKKQLDRTEAELSDMYEEFELEDFQCVLRTILQ